LWFDVGLLCSDRHINGFGGKNYSRTLSHYKFFKFVFSMEKNTNKFGTSSQCDWMNSLLWILFSRKWMCRYTSEVEWRHSQTTHFNVHNE
jgi:hypothetical protein